MTIFASIKYWKVTAKVGQMEKTYKIRIEKGFGCCTNFSLFVNSVEIANNLPLESWSPFYKIRGEFAWEQDENSFLLVRDSLLFTACAKKYRLFINKFDSETGLEFTEFWKHRGWQHIFVGICILALGIGIALILSYVRGKSSLLGFTIALFIFGFVVVVFGIFLIAFKHTNPADFYVVQSRTPVPSVNEGYDELDGSTHTLTSDYHTETTVETTMETANNE